MVSPNLASYKDKAISRALKSVNKSEKGAELGLKKAPGKWPLFPLLARN